MKRICFVGAVGLVVSAGVIAAGAVVAASARRAVAISYDDGSVQAIATTGPAGAVGARPRTLGVNLETPRDYGRGMEFINVIKSSRRWGSTTKPFDDKANVAVDGEGNPLGDFGVRVLTDQPANRAGVYRFSATGRVASIKASGGSVGAVAYDAGTNTTRAEVTVPAPRAGKLINLELVFFGTGGGLKNLKLLRPGYESDERVFTTELLRACAGPGGEFQGGVRLMDWQRTNNSVVTGVADRPRVADAHWTAEGKGVPIEVCLELGVRLGRPVWVCVPHAADDAYVELLGRLIAARAGGAGAPAAPPVYVEYSNEVWNYQFAQAKWNLNRAAEDAASGVDFGTTNLDKRRWARAAWRSVRIGQVLRGAIRAAGGDPSVLRLVLATQVNTGNDPGKVLAAQLEYVRARHGEPGEFFYGVACAPYFSCGSDPDDPTGKRWFTERTDLTVDSICGRLLEKAPPHAATAGQRRCAELARAAGLVLLGYELGADLQQFASAVEVKAASQRDPRAGQAVERYLDAWFQPTETGGAVGGREGWFFALSSPYNRNGYWGLTEDVADVTTAKLTAAAAVARRLAGEGN